MIDFEKYMIAEEGLFSKRRDSSTQKKEDLPDVMDLVHQGAYLPNLMDMLYQGTIYLEMKEGNDLNKPGHLVGDKVGYDFVKYWEKVSTRDRPNYKNQIIHGKRLWGIIASKEGVKHISKYEDVDLIVFPKKDESGKIKWDGFPLTAMYYYYKTLMVGYMRGKYDS